MRSMRERIVPVCQQMLALAVVCAALIPASRVVSLDVVSVAPEAGVTQSDIGSAGGLDVELSAYVAENDKPSLVASAPGEAIVRDVALTPAVPARGAGRVAATPKALTSAPQSVTGLGTVGITWDPRSVVPDHGIDVEVRSRTDEGWSEWTHLEYEAEHGPDPDSDEGRRARPGTEAVVVGRVDQVQVRAAAEKGRLPHDLTLSVIEPGVPVPTEQSEPEIDTATMGATPAAAARTDEETTVDPVEDVTSEDEAEEEGLDLATTSVTPKPKIFSRAQWGADERIRGKSSLSYFEVHGGFVHHTVNANSYKRRDVPALLRSIYAYHVRSRGWSDVGYNFLVDRFGRIWEGRYGGVDRPVVGAHTLGYNDYAFAMSAIGNFEETKPSAAMLEAYGALFAWKLSLHGVRADDKNVRIGSKNFGFSVNGHRDAGSTACPGRYLYKKLNKIRKLATALQADWSGRELLNSVVGGPVKDLVLRRRSDNMGVVVPLRRTSAGNIVTGAPIETGLNLKRSRAVFTVGDWNRDGYGDIITQAKKGALRVRLGDGNGGFGLGTIKLAAGYRKFTMLTSAGDVTGDGYPDLIGQPQGSGMRIFPGAGVDGVTPSYPAYGVVNAGLMAGVGRWDADGTPDVVIRRDNTLSVWGTNGPGGLTGTVGASMDVTKFDWIVGAGVTGFSDHADLLMKRAKRGGLFLVPGGSTGFGKPMKIGRGFNKYDLVG